jgi:hypothetical protein
VAEISNSTYYSCLAEGVKIEDYRLKENNASQIIRARDTVAER